MKRSWKIGVSIGTLILLGLCLTGCMGLLGGPPVVRITADPVSGEAELTVAFTANIIQKDAEIVLFEWIFGDGTKGSGESVVHTYTSAGIYTVQLRASDECGRISEWSSQTIEVREAPKPPVIVAIHHDPPSGQCCMYVKFWATVQGDADTYEWDFGDGRPISKEYNPTYRYLAAGTYRVSLRVRFRDGPWSEFKYTSVTVGSCCDPCPSCCIRISPERASFLVWTTRELQVVFDCNPCGGCSSQDAQPSALSGDEINEAQCCPPPPPDDDCGYCDAYISLTFYYCGNVADAADYQIVDLWGQHKQHIKVNFHKVGEWKVKATLNYGGCLKCPPAFGYYSVYN